MGINGSYAQTVVFSDDFESGTGNWTLQGTWELTTSLSCSPNNSLTTANSSGAYLENQNISATMAHGVNLSSYKGAEIDFNTQYVLEQGFDYTYLEVSIDNGNTWYKIDSFNGTLSSWTLLKYDISSFAGNSNVLARIRLQSDQYIQYAGMYIDDFKIIGLPTDVSPPFIVVQSPVFYQGSQSNETISSQIFDATGVQSAALYYKTGSSSTTIVNPSSIVGNNYTFIIPNQPAGTLVYYKIGATDCSTAQNCSDTSKAQPNYYIAGTYLNYDNSAVDGVSQFASTSGASVEMTSPSGSTFTLVSALIRNYTDPNFVNSQMLFHVWSDDGTGKPGTDLITPFFVTPSATLLNPYPMTVVDLRPFASQLTDLSGNFFIGFTVPSGSVNIINSNAALGKRSFSYNGTSWSSVTNIDYEFRAVINDNGSLPVELTTFSAKSIPSGVELNWSTATESNNHGFNVERKSDNNWQEIGFVSGNGNSNSPKHYIYVDNNLTGGSNFQYRLKQIDNNGNCGYSNIVEINAAPSDFELSQNYPNPFNPSTLIRYQIPKSSVVTLAVFDMLGGEVKTLINGIKEQGNYSVEFNGSNLASGVYIYRLVISPTDGTKAFLAVKKLMLLK